MIKFRELARRNDHKCEDLKEMSIAAGALELLDIDEHGLDEMDKRILRLMAENYNGGPVGLGTIGVAVGEEDRTVEEVQEPYLIMEGYIKRTSTGRVLTEKAWSVLGLSEHVV